ncbi:uncharacterized protein ARMOST_18454 [Armillaria ostoyae]|uniref:Uncharacterized protein n=1 Tax=Armillaria ostoyae TaxID=47428 RepID=A0A284S1W0_ARMOS|nr:uncharacterized protein ARMOST_18454 [Armillaria ostoyae]
MSLLLLMAISPGISCMPWRLDIHIEGDWETLLLPEIYPPRVHERHTGSDLIDEEPPRINESPSQRRVDNYKVLFNCGLVGMHNFLTVQSNDIPLLPLQLLLQCIHGYTSSRIIESNEESQDVVAIEAYLAKDPKRQP